MAERPHIRRLALAIAAVVAGALVLWLIRDFTTHEPPAAPQPAVPVDAAIATVRDVPALLPAVGTVLSTDVVNVMPQVSGRITRIYFKQGQEVKAGQRLFQIDPRPYEAALEEAQGNLARDRASLAEAVMDLARYRKLESQNSIPLQTVQDQVYVVGQDRGTVKLDEGAVAAAKVNLAYCEITSPISGRTGVLQVELGNYVQPASAASQARTGPGASGTSGSAGGTGGAGAAAPLVTITRMHPIFVSFSVPENLLATIRENQARGALPVAAYTSAGERLATGTLTLIDNQVDTATGTILLEGTFANRRERLWPNQFVSVELTEFVRRHAITVPSVAVMTGPSGQYVYLIGPDHKVKRVGVTVTATQQGLAVIGKGLAAGDEVVTDGQYRLDDGVLVSVQASPRPPRSGGSQPM